MIPRVLRRQLAVCLYGLLSLSLVVLAFLQNSIHIVTDAQSMLIAHDYMSQESYQAMAPLLDQSRRSLRFVMQGRGHKVGKQKLLKGLTAMNTVRILSQKSVADQWIQAMGPYQFYLPSPYYDQLFKETPEIQQLLQRIVATLSSPTALSAALNLAEDPILQLYYYTEMVLEQHAPLLFSDTDTQSLVVAEIDVHAFQTNDPAILVAAIESIVANATTPTCQIEWSGYVRFAEDSARRLRAEIEWYSGMATVLVLAITFLVFRSFRQLLLTMISVAYGLGAGILITISCLGSIHAITIGFGAGLIGVSVDYAMHYFCEQLASARNVTGDALLSRILVPISIGTVTSVLVFVGLSFAGFPGLQELALFGSSGLLAAFFTVCVLFPRFSSGGLGRPDSTVLHLAGTIFASIDTKLRSWSPTVLYGSLVLLGLPGICVLKVDDDVRLLQSVSPSLVASEQLVQTSFPFSANTFYVSRASTLPELSKKLLRLEQSLSDARDAGAVRAFIPLAVLVPFSESAQQQAQKRHTFISNQRETLMSSLTEFGYDREVLESWFEHYKELPAIPQIEGYATLVEDSPMASYMSLQGTSLAVVTPVEESMSGHVSDGQVSDTSERIRLPELFSSLLRKYRERSVVLAVLSYLVIYGLFTIRYGRSIGWQLLLPSVLTAYLVLACIGYCGFALNFFHVLGVIIVLGLSVDYNVFFHEEGVHHRPVCLTVLLSTASTSLAFLPLSWSSTLVLSSFGISIGGGVLLATFLAPLGGIHRES